MIKRKLLFTFLAISVCLATSFSLFGCNKNAGEGSGDENQNTPHTHSLVKHEAKNPTCTADGHAEYYSCSCSAIFADSDGKTEIESPEIFPAAHTPKVFPGVKPNCDHGGYSAYRICIACDEIITPPEQYGEAHAEEASAEIWGFSLESIDGRAYVVAYGGNVKNVCSSCGGEIPLKIAADFQHNMNIDGISWNSVAVYADKNNISSSVGEATKLYPAVDAVISGDSFEAYFDVTDFEPGWTLTIHAGLDGRMADMKTQGNGDGAAVFADGKKFSFIQDKTTTWNIISLQVTEAEENEYNLMGRVGLKEIDGKPYLVYRGSWNAKNTTADAVKAKIEADLAAGTFDIQQYSTWARAEFAYSLELDAGGSLTLALDLSALAVTGNALPYYMHCTSASAQNNGNVTLPCGNDCSITVGNLTYEVAKGCSLESWMSALTVIYVREAV